MTLRVTWLPFATSRRVASVRLRTVRPMTYLQGAGWDVSLHRTGDLPDVAVFQKAYSADQLVEAARLKARGVRIVADLCDNHLWVPQWTPATRDRAERMRRLIDMADVVVAAAPALAEAVPGCTVIVDDALELPTPMYTTGLRRMRRLRSGRPLRLLWFGTAGHPSQSGGLSDLAALAPALQQFAQEHPLTLTVVSNSRATWQRLIGPWSLRQRYLPWSRGMFALAVANSDVAVIPVSLDPFTRCKTANRPATALLRGLACIADAVPSYAALASGMRIGDWEHSLRAYANDEVRAEESEVGEGLGRQHYAPARITQQWVHALNRARDLT